MQFGSAGSVLCLAFTMTGCASIVSGVNQPIAVETRLNGDPFPGAACKLTSNKGTWFVNTPGSIVVHRGFQDLLVACTKDGVPPATASIASSTKAMAFGNILFGGVIGVGVDAGTGAAYDYPTLISIEMGAATTPANAAAPTASPPSTPTMESASTSAAPVPNPSSYDAPAPASLSRSLKYQFAAESFVKYRSCTTRPQAVPKAAGPASETYSIACASGDPMVVTCEYGKCREPNG